MKPLRMKTTISLLILSAAIISLSGCAAKKAAWGSMENGMIMKYSYQPDRTLKYNNTYSFEQEMEVMEQKFTITAEGDQLLSMLPVSNEGNNIDYQVTVSEMSSKFKTPRGEMKAKLDDIIGKSFSLTVSNTGEELEYSEAEALTYDYGSGDIKSLSSDIQAFFPDLPDHPVKVGDSWESEDVVTEKTSAGQLILEFNNYNTFEKLEAINGHDCMKINVEFTGTLEGYGKQDDMELFTTGTLGGTATWYYAYKEGIFVKQVMTGVGETETLIKGPQEMTMPASRTYTMVSELIPE